MCRFFNSQELICIPNEYNFNFDWIFNGLEDIEA